MLIFRAKKYGVVDGWKSRFKDCLQQSKINLLGWSGGLTWPQTWEGSALRSAGEGEPLSKTRQSRRQCDWECSKLKETKTNYKKSKLFEELLKTQVQ